jgi:hypothetical protein
MRRAVGVAAALAATAAVAAPAQAEVFVAYGEGATTCTIEVERATYKGITTGGENYQSYLGETDCNVPLEQTSHATVPASGSEPAMDGGLCSGIRASCASGEEDIPEGNSASMVYRMSVRAPRGQGWLGAPVNCSGVGTDNLQCEFVVEIGWTPDLVREWLP